MMHGHLTALYSSLPRLIEEEYVAVEDIQGNIILKVCQIGKLFFFLI